MFKFIKKYFGFYYLLFFASYTSIYFKLEITPFINIFILIVSYYLIIKRQRLDIIIILILYSRCLNGFIFMHNKNAYLITNLLTNIIPIILYFSAIIGQKKITLKQSLFTHKYRYTIVFFLLLTISFFLNYSISYDLITKRYLPFTFFILFLIFNRLMDFKVTGLIRFFRSIFFASVILYFFSNYLQITRILIESDSVFSVASPPNSYSLVYLSFTRNMGFVWDHRILAIFAYLYLLLAVVYKPKNFKIDIFLSLIIVITSTSRGGMITYILILLAYLFYTYRYKFIIFLSFSILVLIITLIVVDVFLPPSTLYFLKSFDPSSQYNAMSQRDVFSTYALNAFKEYPLLGNGVGFLSSHSIDRNLIVDGVKVPAVGDAYWYVLLGEMGLVGFVLYLLFLFEVFYTHKLLSVALLLGFSLQLLGTDIPDMRFYYFAILVIVFVINMKFKTIELKEVKHV